MLRSLSNNLNLLLGLPSQTSKPLNTNEDTPVKINCYVKHNKMNKKNKTNNVNITFKSKLIVITTFKK